jgi:hypothetical protein
MIFSSRGLTVRRTSAVFFQVHLDHSAYAFELFFQPEFFVVNAQPSA